MSIGPVVPSVEEMMHLIVSIAIHRAGWFVRDLVIGGVVATEWPTIEEAPPVGLVAGDVAVLRPRDAHDAGAREVIEFEHTGASVAVRIWRLGTALEESWDAGTHTPVAGAVALSDILPVANPLGFAEIVFVGPRGFSYAQLVDPTTIDTATYCGYLSSSMREVDLTGEDLAEGPEWFPAAMCTSIELPVGAAQTFDEYGANIAAESRRPVPAEPASYRGSVPTFPLYPIGVYDVSGAAFLRGTIPLAWGVDSLNALTSFSRLVGADRDFMLVRDLAFGALDLPHFVLPHVGSTPVP